jgi:hypothetical protein
MGLNGLVPVAFAAIVNKEPSKAFVENRRTTSAQCYSDGTAKSVQKLSYLYGSVSAFYTLESGDTFGMSVASLGDLNGDGVGDLAVAAHSDDDGGAITGSVYVLFLETDATVRNAQKLSMLYGNLDSFCILDAGDRFGVAIVALGDVNDDGVVDLAVGAHLDDDGGSDAGAAYVLFLETDGTAKFAQKLSALYGNFNTFYTLDSSDDFGRSVAGPGDLDGDGVVDMAVGAVSDADGGSGAGAVYLLFLKTDGTCKSAQKLSNHYGNFNMFYALDASDNFGVSVASLGDVNEDSVVDLAVSAYDDDDGGTDTGAVYILFLETDGTIKGAQKVSNLYGSFNAYYTLTAARVFYLDLG